MVYTEFPVTQNQTLCIYVRAVLQAPPPHVSDGVCHASERVCHASAMKGCHERSHTYNINLNKPNGKFIDLVQLTPQLGMRAIRIFIIVCFYIGIVIAIKRFALRSSCNTFHLFYEFIEWNIVHHLQIKLAVQAWLNVVTH